MSARTPPRRPEAMAAASRPSLSAQNRRLVWLGALVLAVAAWLAYRGSLGTPFLFDDIPAVVENASIRDLSEVGRVLHPPATGAGIDSRPLVNLSLAVNYALGGLNPRGYHLANLTIHVLGALTLFGLLRRILLLPGLPEALQKAALPAAFCCALLWTVHPLQTETVICVIQRNESLVSLFYLLTLYCFLWAAGPGGRAGWYWPALGACLAGMATKEVMVSAPLIVLLFDRTFLAGSFGAAWRLRGRWHAALAATWVLLAVLVLSSGGGRGGTAGFDRGVSAWTYLLTQSRAIVIYLKLAVWPHPLVVDYGTWLAPGFGAVALEFAAVATLFTLTLLALWRWPRAGFAGACFFAILAPSSSVYPLVSQTIAEHRMYLPLAAMLVLLVAGLFRLAGLRWMLAGCALLAVGATALTIRRGADYATEQTLWTDLINKAPDNAWAHFNLAKMYFRQGAFAQSEVVNREAVRLMPGSPSMQLAWGISLEKSGRPDEAAAAYREALRLKPDLPPALFRLGFVSLLRGRAEEAVLYFARSLQLHPDNLDATGNLGTALVQLGRFAQAVPQFERVIASRPESVDAHYNLALALARLGRNDEALAHFETAARLSPASADLQASLGAALAAAGRPAEAIPHYERSLQLKPGQPAVHFNLGHALLLTGRTPEAREHFAEAWRLDPALQAAREMLDRLPATP